MTRIVAIDGPSGAGKSTMARELAGYLGYIYVDTGALYRAIGLFVLSKNVNASDEKAIIPLLSQISIELRYKEGEQRVFLNKEDVSGNIRTEDVSMAASAVSALPAVREFLLGLQRKISRENDVVMDGRDIGTVVAPDAALKIFLTATPEDRAMRRYEELVKRGVETNYEDLLKDMKIRDNNDQSRETSPLRPAEDAIIVDTTGNELWVSIELLKKIVKENLST